MPCATATSTILCAMSASATRPNMLVPKHASETFTPVRPKFLYCMVFLPCVELLDRAREVHVVLRHLMIGLMRLQDQHDGAVAHVDVGVMIEFIGDLRHAVDELDRISE